MKYSHGTPNAKHLTPANVGKNSQNKSTPVAPGFKHPTVPVTQPKTQSMPPAMKISK